MGLDSERAARYFTARIEQLHAALEFAQKQIKAGNRWDADCEKIISEALTPSGLPEGFTLADYTDLPDPSSITSASIAGFDSICFCGAS